MTIFELHHELVRHGWECFTKSPKPPKEKTKKGKAKGAENAMPVPIDYFFKGGEKRWWIERKQTTLRPKYMLALLSSIFVVSKRNFQFCWIISVATNTDMNIAKAESLGCLNAAQSTARA